MEEYSPETCAWCQGSGNDPQSGHLLGRPNQCPVCGGQGSLIVVQPAMRCARCKGTGKEEPSFDHSGIVFRASRCQTCQGSGWAYTKNQRYARSDAGIERSSRGSGIYEEDRNRRSKELDVLLQKAEDARQRELDKLQRQAEEARQREYEIRQKINGSENLVSKGDYYLENNLYDEAMACYEESIRINPNTNAWIKKGLALFKNAEYEMAIKCYVEAIWIEPDNSAAWNNKGSALAKQGKFDEAIKCYDECMRIEPNNSIFVENKQKAFNSLMKSYKNDVISWADRGRGFHNKKKYNEAIWCYDEILKLESQDASAWKERGDVLDAMGKSNEAKRSHAIAWNLKGKFFASSGRHNEAFECYNEALKIYPNDITFQTNKSTALIAATKANTHDKASWIAKAKFSLIRRNTMKPFGATMKLLN